MNRKKCEKGVERGKEAKDRTKGEKRRSERDGGRKIWGKGGKKRQ